jgi:hypothetical protein
VGRMWIIFSEKSLVRSLVKNKLYGSDFIPVAMSDSNVVDSDRRMHRVQHGDLDQNVGTLI